VAIDRERARAAKSKVKSLLPKGVRVNGLGLTQVGDDYAVKLNLESPLRPGVELPASIDGVPLVVEHVGPIAKREPGRSGAS
jgi:hypothetical protein